MASEGARSSHPGFPFSISVIFLARDQPFNCFSRAMALSIAGHADIKAARLAAQDVGPSSFGYHR